MLILSRKLDEDINLFPNGIKITVRAIEIEGNRVRIGVIAPKDVPIERGEVTYRRLAAEAAAQTGAIPQPTQLTEILP